MISPSQWQRRHFVDQNKHSGRKQRLDVLNACEFAPILFSLKLEKEKQLKIGPTNSKLQICAYILSSQNNLISEQ